MKPTDAKQYEASQARGDLTSYDRYLKGMDASMRQKVALTAAHLLCEGKVADMGMGSGTGSEALAALYPRLQVVGVDIDPTVVDLARAKFTLPNLSFVVGDVAKPVFAAESLDGIFDSSVLHHVTSYGGYRLQNASEAIAAHVEQLRLHGVLVVRDFVDPGPGEVWLDVPANDGDDSHNPATASTASLLERFSGEFRSLSDSPGFQMQRMDEPSDLPALPQGWRRYRMSHKHAVEFVLRKDYRRDWEAEVKEEYTYLSQAGFEQLFAQLGLRVLASMPIRNPWIVQKRFEGKFVIRSIDGAALPLPATNYLIVGEKVEQGGGLRFSAEPLPAPLEFLRLEHHRDRQTGRVFDLASRPHATIDILPYFRQGDAVYVLARTNYPRPILAMGRDAPLDGSGSVVYVAEPLNVVQGDRPIGATVEETLLRGAGIRPDQIRSMMPGTTYYPSPGGLLEEVRSVFVEIDPLFVNVPLGGVSGFSSSGRVRAISAQQLLRAAQVGGLPDARLEINVHDLLIRLSENIGPWIGAAVGHQNLASVKLSSLSEVLSVCRRRFEYVSKGANFLGVRSCAFTEHAADGKPVAKRSLEFVEPTHLGSNTIAAALLARDEAGQLAFGVDEDDLPAAQLFNGNSNILVTPAWRIPRALTDIPSAREFVRNKLSDEYGLQVNEGTELGGAYRPSAGLTPEIVFPFAFEVRGIVPGKRALKWIALADLIKERASLTDGHLRVVSARMAHALQG